MKVYYTIYQDYYGLTLVHVSPLHQMCMLNYKFQWKQAILCNLLNPSYLTENFYSSSKKNSHSIQHDAFCIQNVRFTQRYKLISFIISFVVLIMQLVNFSFFLGYQVDQDRYMLIKSKIKYFSKFCFTHIYFMSNELIWPHFDFFYIIFIWIWTK
jgi:hypothetical protein